MEAAQNRDDNPQQASPSHAVEEIAAAMQSSQVAAAPNARVDELRRQSQSQSAVAGPSELRADRTPLIRLEDKGAEATNVPKGPRFPNGLGRLGPATTPEEKQARRDEELRRREMRREAERAHRDAVIEYWAPVVVDETNEHAVHLHQVCRDDATPTPINALEVLDRQMQAFWLKTRPNPSEGVKREKTIQDIQACIDRRWPNNGLKVQPFGSSITGILSAKSDVDLSLLDPSRPFGVGTPKEHVVSVGPERPEINGQPEWYDVRTVAKALRKYGMDYKAGTHRFHNILAIDAANVPIVKFKGAGPEGLSVDININDRFGLANSQMIRAYASLRPNTFIQMCFIVKFWLKRRKCNDPSGEGGDGISLSSYSIVLLIIQYYQVHGQLPNLQNPALLALHNVENHILYQAPKLPRRVAGDPRAGSAEDVRHRIANAFDVTFLDCSQRELRGATDTDGSGVCWRYFVSPESAATALEVDKGAWDETRASNTGMKEHLPSSQDAGLHRCETGKPDELASDFAGFVRWYALLDKRRHVIDIRNGVPLKANSYATRRAWEMAHGNVDGIHQGLASSSETEQSSEAGPVADMSKIMKSTSSSTSENGSASAANEASTAKKPSSGEKILIANSLPPAKAEDHDPTQPIEWESHRIIIRDPFIRDRNTSKNIHRAGADRIEAEFARAARMLDGGKRKQKAAAAASKEPEDKLAEGTDGTDRAAPRPLMLNELWVPWDYEVAVKAQKRVAKEQEKKRALAQKQGLASVADVGRALPPVDGDGTGRSDNSSDSSDDDNSGSEVPSEQGVGGGRRNRRRGNRFSQRAKQRRADQAARMMALGGGGAPGTEADANTSQADGTSPASASTRGRGRPPPLRPSNNRGRGGGGGGRRGRRYHSLTSSTSGNDSAAPRVPADFLKGQRKDGGVGAQSAAPS